MEVKASKRPIYLEEIFRNYYFSNSYVFYIFKIRGQAKVIKLFPPLQWKWSRPRESQTSEIFLARKRILNHMVASGLRLN